jgi:hypothetical protein
VRTSIYAILFLTASLTAQQPAKTKKVWTNDDFQSAPQTPKLAPVTPAPAAPNAQPLKSTEELEARIELRTKWASDLQAALEAANEQLPHASSQEQRHALLTKIKMIERDLEDAGAELQALSSKLTSLKAVPAPAGTIHSDLDGGRR